MIAHLRSRRRLLNVRMPEAKPPSNRDWSVRLSSVELRMDTLETELKEHGIRQQRGFEAVERQLTHLATRLETATSKPPPWGLIVSAFVGICTILIGIGGLGMSMAGGLALWANAYFGRNIQIAEGMARDAQARIEMVQDRQSLKHEKLDTSLHDLEADLRALEATVKPRHQPQP